MCKLNTKDIVMNVMRENFLSSFLLFCSIIASAAFSLMPAQVLKLLIDEYLTRGKVNGLLQFAVLYFSVFLLIGIFDFMNGILLTMTGQKIVRKIRSIMASKLTRIKADYFSKNAGGSIASHFLNDVENINSLFSDGIISMAIDCFKIVGIIISIWIFSSQLGLFVIALLPFIYLLTAYFRKKMIVAQTDNLKEIGKVNNHIAESMKNVLMIKCFHKEAYMENCYDQYLTINYSTMNKVNLYDSCYSPIIQIVTALTTATVLILASGEKMIFGISIGMLSATLVLISGLFTPVDNLGMELQSIQKGISGIRSVDNFLSIGEDERQVNTLDIEALKRDGDVLTFSNMSFSYDDEKSVLANINLQIAPRENICFVGRTGVGKTTLFKLITGLMQPTEGAILIGEANVYNIPNNQKRHIFGYVEQHFSFVQGDISEQLSLGDETILQEQIESAMMFTGLHEYIINLENGYKTNADGGDMFSQGQKQLLSIARAIVTDPPILLLDEVTANLDSVTEDNVVSVLKRAGEQKTILSITHRVSSMIGSDRVVLLKNGRIMAIGTPKQVIENSSWLHENDESDLNCDIRD